MYNTSLNTWVGLVNHGEVGNKHWAERNMHRHNVQFSTYTPETIDIALRVAKHQRCNLVLISDALDELKYAYIEPKTGNRGWVTVSLYNCITTLVKRLHFSDYKIAGVTAQRNLKSYDKEKIVVNDRPIWGCMVAFKPSAPPFSGIMRADAGFGLDYSTLNHDLYGGVVHCRDFIPQYNNAPLTDEEKKELKRKWPNYIKDSDKLPGGMVINWPKQEAINANNNT